MTHAVIPPGPNANAWAFVLQNGRIIDRYAYTFTSGTSLSREDFRGELIADLVATHAKYRPGDRDNGGCGPSSWIFMRARFVRRTMVRAAVRGEALPLVGTSGDVQRDDWRPRAQSEDWHPTPVGAAGHHERTHARVVVLRVLDGATPAQVGAARSLIQGWDRGEVRERLGVSLLERDTILRTIPYDSVRPRVSR